MNIYISRICGRGSLDSIWDAMNSLAFYIIGFSSADTGSHAELHNSDVTSVPWLCIDNHFSLKLQNFDKQQT